MSTAIAPDAQPTTEPAASLPAETAAPPVATPPAPIAPVLPSPPDPFDVSLRQLPAYTRSLLQIEVPVVVTLAAKRDLLANVLQLGLGSILQFTKGCDEALELEVAGRRIAEGEPVKVGDKFGLRITSVALPDERFEPIGKH